MIFSHAKITCITIHRALLHYEKMNSLSYTLFMFHVVVRPHLEYSSAVWDPDRKQHINSIEMVQRRTARFATSTYSREPGTVTNILNTLGWPSLQSRRKTSRLTLLYKATHDKAAINIPSYIRRPSISTRQYYPDKFSQISTSTDAYKFSFLPRTITDWNSLPPEAYQATTPESFKEIIQRLQT